MIIRIATTKDVPQIVKIHMNAFEGFFLTTLGRSFLSFYYNAFVNSKDGIVLCAIIDNEVYGFAAATKQYEAIAKIKGTHYRSKLIDKIGFGAYNSKFEGRTAFDWLSTDTEQVDKYIADKYCGFLFTAARSKCADEGKAQKNGK